MNTGLKWALVITLLSLTACGGDSGGGGGGNSGGNTPSPGSTPLASCSLPSTPVNTSLPSDPLLADQWHLRNIGSPADINLEPLWLNCPESGCKGEGVVVAVVDDGLEIDHPDLVDNTLPLCHRDFRVSSSIRQQDPTPTHPEDAHGTAVAGIIAAQDNDLGGTGVAPRASLLGINLLDWDRSQGGVLVSEMASAMTHQRSVVAVSNNSWGSPDTGHFSAAPSQWKNAITTGIGSIANASRGQGVSYLFAGGNGHGLEYDLYYRDFSSLDEKAGHHGVMTIGALNANDQRASYSELGSNLLISAYGGEFCNAGGPTITTTDLSGDHRGYNGAVTRTTPHENGAEPDYTRCFNGTSAATPMVAGVVALMHQANASISWRDIRWLLAHTARQNDSGNTSWNTNAAGLHYSPLYGFGAVDAHAAVETARNHALLPNYLSRQRSTDLGTTEERTIPAYNQDTSTVGVKTFLHDTHDTTTDFFTVTFDRLEHLTIRIGLAAANSVDTSNFDTGLVRIWLTSPGNTNSLILPFRWCGDGEDKGGNGACETGILSSFEFGNVQFLGEDPRGEWTLTIENLNPYPARINSWSMTFRGHRE